MASVVCIPMECVYVYACVYVCMAKNCMTTRLCAHGVCARSMYACVVCAFLCVYAFVVCARIVPVCICVCVCVFVSCEGRNHVSLGIHPGSWFCISGPCRVLTLSETEALLPEGY